MKSVAVANTQTELEYKQLRLQMALTGHIGKRCRHQIKISNREVFHRIVFCSVPLYYTIFLGPKNRLIKESYRNSRIYIHFMFILYLDTRITWVVVWRISLFKDTLSQVVFARFLCWEKPNDKVEFCLEFFIFMKPTSFLWYNLFSKYYLWFKKN